jgi:hypothetical protein
MYIFCCLKVNFNHWRSNKVKIYEIFKFRQILINYNTTSKHLKLASKQQNMYIFGINELPTDLKCYVSLRSRLEGPLLRFYGHHPAFVLTCEVKYLKNVSMGKRVSWFDFNRANVEGIIAHLSNINWSSIFDAKKVE